MFLFIEEKSFMRNYGVVDETNGKNGDRKLSNRIQGIPEMTITITDGIQYMASLSEKMYK